MVICRCIVSGILTLLLAGCPTPYNLSLDDFDEAGEQAPAAIEISDPQIYTRENLINDRRKEIARLTDLLDASPEAEFVPQLRRDLREISAFTASLQGSFNPAAGAAAGRAEEQAELQHQIDVANLRADLATAQERQILAERRTESARAGETPEGEPGDAVGPDEAPDADVPERPDLTVIQKRLDSLSGKLDKVLSETPKAEATTILSTPREKFRDEQTYREEIRAAIAESNLDDLHDASGNALYRLQFRATVLPGERKGQFGVSRLRVMPPELSAEDIRDLYFAWLGHVTHQLNLPVSDGSVANWRYESLGASANDLYNIVYLALPNQQAGRGVPCTQFRRTAAAGATCTVLRFAVTPPYGVGVQELLNSVSNLDEFNRDLQRLWFVSKQLFDALEAEDFQADSSDSACEAVDSSQQIQGWVATANLTRPLTQILSDVQRLHRFLPILASSIRSLQNAVPHIDNSAAVAVSATLSALNQMVVNAQGVLLPFLDAFPGCRNFDSDMLRNQLRNHVPPAFLRPLIGQDELVAGVKYPPSPLARTYTYSARPIELAQQVSTAASAGNALELSLALSGTVPNSGVNAEAAAGYMRAAIGRMEALERAPIVVGFATAESNKTDDASTEFGWVFGPPVVPDTEQNSLQRLQRVVNHQVFADVSVPGWWPRLRMNIETAWIANWHDGTGVLHRQADQPPELQTEIVRERIVDLRLPRNRANLEDLTDVVARPIWGQQPGTTQIYDVQPKKVFVCNGQTVQFIVLGSNIWRNASVYLNGTEAERDTIRVLPDMAGVTAVFDLAKVAPTADEDTGSELTVWTQNGSDVFRGISLMKPTDEATCRAVAGEEPQG